MTTHGEERAEYVRLLGPILGQVSHELRDEYWLLAQKWREYKDLFDEGEEQAVLLNTVASNFFGFLKFVLFEDVMLHLCRLTDPPRSARRDTLTIRRLAELLADSTFKVEIQTKTDFAKKSCDFARDHRNKRIAHTDLEELRLGVASTLAPATGKQVDEALKAIRDLLDALEGHFCMPHSILGPDPWGVRSLVAYMRRHRTS